MLRPILFELLTKGGHLGVPAAREMLLDPFGRRLELFRQLAHPVAQLGLDLSKPLAVVSEGLVRAFAQGAQLLRCYLCTVTRKTGARFGFFHDDAWPNVAISMESVCVVAQRDFGRSRDARREVIPTVYRPQEGASQNGGQALSGLVRMFG